MILRLAASFILLCNTSTLADVVSLHIPIISESPKLHIFYHELLETAIKEVGHTPKLIVSKIPQLRVKHYMDSGEISIYWMVKLRERNEKYFSTGIDLTNKLIDRRILFIKKGDQNIYDHVQNIDDFRKLQLIGGMGKMWFDVKVWKENNLKHLEQSGSWESIFNMIPLGREYNYFARGVNEIVQESKKYPKLDIEKKLVFIYDRDFHFYLSKTGKNAGIKYKKIVTHALKMAKSSGLIHRLVRKHWSSDFITLNYDKRIKIYLKTPK